MEHGVHDNHESPKAVHCAYSESLTTLWASCNFEQATTSLYPFPSRLNGSNNTIPSECSYEDYMRWYIVKSLASVSHIFNAQ